MKQSVTACWFPPAFENTLNDAFLYNDFVSHKAKLNGSNGGGEQALQGWHTVGRAALENWFQYPLCLAHPCSAKETFSVHFYGD